MSGPKLQGPLYTHLIAKKFEYAYTYNNTRQQPVLTDHIHYRPPVLKDHIPSRPP